MNILLQFYISAFLIHGIWASERAPRALGKNCPRDIDYPNAGRIKYRKQGKKVSVRCKKGFRLYGKKYLVCGQDNKWKGNLPICVKSGCAPIDNYNDVNMVMSEHPQFNDAIITFGCEEDYILFGPREIHCDGTIWSNAPPKCKAITDLMTCDFEDDLCGWTQDHTVFGNKNWTRHIGSTQSGGTGPKRDHTMPNSDTGHYLFFESSNPTKEGDSAVLMSPLYTDDLSPMCFQFWYHMLGPNEPGHVGSLAVYIKSESDRLEALQPAFYKEGNQGDIWHRGEIFIDDQFEPYQIVLKAIKKQSYLSDIAIDDLNLHNCTTTTTTTTRYTTPVTVSSIPPSDSSSTLPVSNSTSPVHTVTDQTLRYTSNVSIVVSTVDKYIVPDSTLSSSHAATPTTGQSLSTAIYMNVSGIKTSMYSTTPSILHNATLTSTDKSSPINTWDWIKSTSIQPTGRPTIQSTGRPNIQSTDRPTMQSTGSPTIQSTGRPTIQSTGRPTMQSTGRPTIQSTDRSTVQPTRMPTRQTSETSTSASPLTAISTLQRVSEEPTTVLAKVSNELFQTSTDFAKLTSGKKSTPAVKPTLSSPIASKRTPFAKMSETTTHSHSSPNRSPSTSVAVYITSHTESQTSEILSTALSTTLMHKPATSNSTEAYKSPTVTDSSYTVDARVRMTTGITKSTMTGRGENSSVTVRAERSEHPADETLKPLMIGLGVGILVGLIVIGVIGWVCMKRRKFYTSRYEDELKPITNAASTHSLNQEEYYQDHFDIEDV